MLNSLNETVKGIQDIPWKKSYDKLEQHVKKQRRHFANKGPYSQSYGFSSSSVKQYLYWASQVVLVVKNLPANAGDIRDMDSISGSGRSPGGRHGNPLPYSLLENPMDRGAC